MARKDLTFRVFVSSTFSDLIAERNALQEQVYPRLQEYCQQHQAQFQAIDLRWGISQEAALDQQTMSICIQELHRCQQLSPRPNFIVLLADRYGWRPLPPRIDAAEFEMLLSQLDSGAQAALGAWYQRDDNAMPPIYWLRPREGEYADPQRWAEEEFRLHDLLLTAAVRAFKLGDPRRQRYERSATHQEIELGALDIDDAEQHVYCYFRTTRGLPEGAEAGRYKDARHGEADPDASARQALLQADLKRKLPPDHVYEWQPEWRDGGLTSDLGRLCRRVEDDLKATIDLELSAFEQVAPLERERDAHRAFGRERAANFVGRQDLLYQIESYISSDDRLPLVIHGRPGSGKSALLAESSRRLAERDGVAYVLTRFIGGTPDSSDLRYLLTGIAQELGHVYGADSELPGDPQSLAEELKLRLAASTAERPLVAYVDALDQLSDAEAAHTLTWLPRELGPDTKLVVSILEDDGPAGACLRNARGLLPAERFLEVGSLPSEDGAKLLETWLAEVGRTLRPEQRRHVLDRFADCPYPLYLKLAFEEGRRWRSDDGLPPLGPDVPAILGDLFTRLERPEDHGPVLPARGLAYLAASRRGLSEDELLDVLSADEQVMDELRRHSPDSPRADRLPVVFWSRLLADLEPYLTRHERHGAQLLTFYHRQVEAAVRARYLVDGDAASAHRRLAGYFEQHWRQPSPRALDELPYQLAEAADTDRLAGLLGDLVFLGAKAAAGMAGDLASDYERARSAFGAEWDEEGPVASFARFVSHESHFLWAAPGALHQQAFNSAEQSVSAAAARLLRSGGFRTSPWLRKTAGTARQRHSGTVISMAFWGGDRDLVVSTTEREVWVWDLARGSLFQRCEPPRSAAKSLAVSPDGEFLAAGFGAINPTPLAAGAVVWGRHGRIYRDYQLEDWVYHVRWRGDSDLVLAAGQPSGADATGTLWHASVHAATCEEIPGYLADLPLVLTWDPVPGSTDEISILSMDGVVCRLTPEFVPMTAAEVSELVSQVWARDGLDAYEIDATVEAEIAARRPLIQRLQSPCTGDEGFHHAAQVLGQNTICVLGGPPVPVELRMVRDCVPGGLYVHDLDQGNAYGVRFKPEALEAGFRAICLGATADGSKVAIGTAHGQASLVSLDEDHVSIEPIHNGDFEVTAVCFSDSGTSVAIGGAGGEIAVYDQTGRGLIFGTQQTDRPLVARTAESVVLILHPDRLAFVPLRADVEGGPEPRDLVLPEGSVAIDFDRHGDVVVVLTRQQVKGDTAETEEEHEEEAAAYRDETVVAVNYSVHVVDLAGRQIVRTTDVPGHIPLPPGSTADARKPDFLRWIRLRVHDDQVGLLVGSARGLMEYPFGAFENGRPFLLPFDREAADRRHNIGMIRLGLLNVSCESVSVTPSGGTIYCGYADNEDPPRISGELHAWDARTGTPSAEQRFPGTVQALAAASDGVVIGTDDNGAGFWQYDGDWRPLNEVRHGAAVVAVACSEERGLACSVSRDGALVGWPYRGGPPLLQTFVDVEPISVGFAADGHSVWIVDRNSEVHVWEIELQ